MSIVAIQTQDQRELMKPGCYVIHSGDKSVVTYRVIEGGKLEFVGEKIREKPKPLTNRQRQELVDFVGPENIFYQDIWSWCLMYKDNEVYFDKDGYWVMDDLNNYGQCKKIEDGKLILKLDRLFLKKVYDRFKGFSRVLKEIRDE